jgi:hypothetical protein
MAQNSILRSPVVEQTAEFSRCLAATRNGKNLFITGKAGTGKSTLLRLIRDSASPKEIAVVAPTGVAALNVDGATIHRVFGFRKDLTPDLHRYRAPDYLQEIDILVIDEVSMVSADLMDMMSTALQRARHSSAAFGGVQVVMIGDLFQLPPVSMDEVRDTYYATDFFFSSRAFEESNVDTIELTKVFRQKDPLFVNILNAIRDGSVTDAHLDRLNARCDPSYKHTIAESPSQGASQCMTIATTRSYVDEINSRMLAGIRAEARTYVADRSGEIEDKAFDSIEQLRLKPGAQVMMLVNQDDYANGTVAEVRGLGDDEITVFIPEIGDERQVKRYRWEVLKPTRKNGKIVKEVVGVFEQYPMQLAWAVTVHKSQGKTFDRVVFDCKRIFEDGQTYVALSRCRSLEGLTLTQPIEQRHIKVSSAVRRFYRSCTSQRVPITSQPTVFVGLHTTGDDKYRKLVEVGVLRVEAGVEVLKLSTLIAPGRDASMAASVGINASDLTLCPSIEEARDILGLAMDGACVVGCHVHDILALSNWPEGTVEEGVYYELGKIPFGEGERPTALELAQQARSDFDNLLPGHREQIQAAPFRFLSRTITPGSYLYGRAPIDGSGAFFSSEAFRSLDASSQATARQGIAIGMIAHGASASIAQSKTILRRESISASSAEEVRLRFVAKAEKDQRVSFEEARFVNRLGDLFGMPLENALVEKDLRTKAAFRRGMKVYLSGQTGKAGSSCEGMSKEDVRDLCADAGLVFLSGFRKGDKPDALIVADLSTQGKKRVNADRWKVDLFSWEELLQWVRERKQP